MALQLFRTSYFIVLLWVADLLFSSSVPLLTLFVHCFPNQSREVFPELQGHLARRRCDRLTSMISPNLNSLTGGLSGNSKLVAGYYQGFKIEVRNKYKYEKTYFAAITSCTITRAQSRRMTTFIF